MPRRLVIESFLTEDGGADGDPASSSFKTITQLGELDQWHIGAAAVPALIITVLFFFDHNVSALLAQSPEFGQSNF